MKSSRRFRQIILALILLFSAPISAYAQTDCSNLLKHGLYNSFREENDDATAAASQHDFCSIYNKYQQDKASGNAGASYDGFGGSASFSTDQLNYLGTEMCESGHSDSDAQAHLAVFSQVLDPSGVAAFNECIKDEQAGLISNVTWSDTYGTGFSQSIHYEPPVGTLRNHITFNGVVIGSNDSTLSCKGNLFTLRPGTDIGDNDAYLLVCTRKFPSQPVLFQGQSVWALPNTVTVSTSAGNIVDNLDAVAAGPPPTPVVLPVGTIIPFSGTMAEAVAQTKFGWWVADGRTVQDHDAKAFDGKNTPNLSNRFLLGRQIAAPRVARFLQPFHRPR